MAYLPDWIEGELHEDAEDDEDVEGHQELEQVVEHHGRAAGLEIIKLVLIGGNECLKWNYGVRSKQGLS